MIVTLHGRINVEGQWWDIDTQIDVKDTLTGEQKIRKIKLTVRGLTSAGIISTVPAPGNVPVQMEAPQGNGITSDGTEAAAFVLPPPHCPDHRGEMRVSTVQKDAGKVNYYCTNQGEYGYCTHRASVDKGSGMPKFYKVRKQ